MSLLGQSVTQLNPIAADVKSPLKDDEKPSPPAATVSLQTSPPLPAATFGHPAGPTASNLNTEPPLRVQPDPASQYASRPSLPAMSHASLNLPEVQHYVVEHIVKSDDSTMHSTSVSEPFREKRPDPKPNQIMTHGVLELNYH